MDKNELIMKIMNTMAKMSEAETAKRSIYDLLVEICTFLHAEAAGIIRFNKKSGKTSIFDACPGVFGEDLFLEKIKKIESVANLLGKFEKNFWSAENSCEPSSNDQKKDSFKDDKGLLRLTGLSSLIFCPVEDSSEKNELFLCVMNLDAEIVPKNKDKKNLFIKSLAEISDILLTARKNFLHANKEHQALKLITNINTLLNKNENLPAIAKTTAKKTAKLLDSDACSVIISEANQLRFFAASGNKGNIIENLTLPKDSGIAGKVIKQGRAYISQNAQTDPDFNPYIDIVSKYNTQNLMAVPMKTSSRIIGVIEVVNKKQNQEFTSEDLQLLKDLAYQLTLIFEQIISKEKISHLEMDQSKLISSGKQKINELEINIKKALDELKKAQTINATLSGQFKFTANELSQTRIYLNDSISALKIAENKNLAAQQELNDLKEAQEVFMASYENETPEKRLFKIVSFFEELITGSLNPLKRISDISHLFTEGGLSFRDKKEISVDLLEHTDRLERLLAMVYHVTRFICGKTLLSNIDVHDINRILLLQIERLSEIAARKSCTIKYIPQSASPLMARVSIRAIEHLVFILIDNSVKYAKKGQQNIFVKSEQINKSIHITIKDEALGIEARFIEKIFKPFFRVPGSNRYAGGLGIGLALAKAIAGAHGGNLTIKSSPGIGTTIKITLPIL